MRITIPSCGQVRTAADVDAIMNRQASVAGLSETFCINGQSLAQFNLLFLRCLFRTKAGMDKALSDVGCSVDILQALLVIHHEEHRADFTQAWKTFLKSPAKAYMDPIWDAGKGAGQTAAKGKRPYD